MLRSSVALCPVCGHLGELGKGPGGRLRAACRECGSLERHRGLVGVVAGLHEVAAEGLLLDVAPSPLMSRHLADVAATVGVKYIGMDFDPAADARAVEIQASLTSIPLKDASVGLLVCFHVLEHVPDDQAAIAEIRRVLAPEGLALVQVPVRVGLPTDEDPCASAEERVARFGQADHVRYYGLADFEARLEDAGLKVHRLTMGDLYNDLACDLLGVLRDEALWLCTTGSPVDVTRLAEQCSEHCRGLQAAMTRSIVAKRSTAHAQELRVDRVRARMARARRERERAVRHAEQLFQRPEVRIGSSVRRRFRSLLRRLGKSRAA